jgi:hypothetical protein
MRITFDTNIISLDGLLSACSNLGWDAAIVSVTRREVEGTSFEVRIEPFGEVPESAVLDESRFGEAVYGSDQTAIDLDRILKTISGGTFPANRSQLSKGQLRQLRDAMIFEAHARDARDVFVTNDRRGFIAGGRRAALEAMFATRIMTSDEFVQFCSTVSKGGAQDPAG